MHTAGLEIRREERSLSWSLGLEVTRMMRDSRRRKLRLERWRMCREAIVARQPVESSKWSRVCIKCIQIKLCLIEYWLLSG